MTVRGTPRANALVVAQIQVDYLRNPVRVTALGALVDEKTGRTLGYTNGDGGTWSNETLEKLNALREAMEHDLASKVFTEGPSRGVVQPEKRGLAVVGGLGEHLGDGADAPSI